MNVLQGEPEEGIGKEPGLGQLSLASVPLSLIIHCLPVVRGEPREAVGTSARKRYSKVGLKELRLLTQHG